MRGRRKQIAIEEFSRLFFRKWICTVKFRLLSSDCTVFLVAHECSNTNVSFIINQFPKKDPFQTSLKVIWSMDWIEIPKCQKYVEWFGDFTL